MPGPSETEPAPGSAPAHDTSRDARPPDDAPVTTQSLHEAQDEAIERVIENDARHPLHEDDAPTATRDDDPPARPQGLE